MLPNQLDTHLRRVGSSFWRRNGEYVRRVHDQQGLRDVSGGSEGPGRLHEASRLARAVSGFARGRVRRFRRDAGCGAVSLRSARYLTSPPRLALRHCWPELLQKLRVSPMCSLVCHGACSE